ncbi:hypothetical protein [Maridesulfovibrio sp.]|uniref:hypothetical protein n=1 Tax=Maridesulfovibrio sp. TaxID=2795000 RepID=UPI002A18E101|nr:hypothetical protein [Maridesulfovibrio sp.]
MTLSIGIFASKGIPQVESLIQKLAETGVDAFFFDMGLPPEERVCLYETGARWNDIELTELNYAYVHGFSFQSPVVPNHGGERDWSVWQADYPAQQQKYSFLHSLFTRLERHGVRMITPVEALQAMFAKHHLLQNLSRDGFSVPEMLVTNVPQEAEKFCEKHEIVIWRPQNGKAAWQLCLEKQRTAIIHPDLPPPILASAIKGPVVRSWIFNGNPLLTLRSAPPSAAVPERLEQLSTFDSSPFEKELSRLAETLGAPWFQVLFVPQGKHLWIYDIDTDPIYDWLPEIYADTLTNNLVAGLVGTPAAQKNEDSSAKRPAIFLRRMLRILFDFENCKYGK